MDTQYRFGEIRAIPDNVDETRTVEFVISNETKDRHGSILKVDRWDLRNYNRNPIVGYQHNLYGDNLCSPPNPDDIIGKSEVFFEGDNLIGRVTFEPADINPLAEKVFQKVKFGTLRMASVGFIGQEPHYGEGDEARGGKNQTEYYKRQELIEWSIVNIPSNPTAGKREFNVQSDRALKYIANLTGLPIADIKKMTINGIIRIVTGEGVAEDEAERNAENKLTQEQAELLERKRQEEQNNELQTLSDLMGRIVNKYEDK